MQEHGRSGRPTKRHRRPRLSCAHVNRFEVACLTPALLAFFYGTGPYGQHGQTWNSVLLFGGIALSRIGLWSFDLCQVSEITILKVNSRD